MAVIKSGISSDLQTVDATSKAARVTLYDSAGREASPQSKACYVAASTFTPPATPTDMVIIEGSATKVIRIVSIRLATTNTAAGSQQFFVVKRSTANTTGTFVAAIAVPVDANDGAATVNRVGHFTANPGALGALVGNIAITRAASPAAVPASFAGVMQEAAIELIPQEQQHIMDRPITLRGVAQCLAVNFAGVALVAGQTHAYCIRWTEE